MRNLSAFVNTEHFPRIGGSDPHRPFGIQTYPIWSNLTLGKGASVFKLCPDSTVRERAIGFMPPGAFGEPQSVYKNRCFRFHSFNYCFYETTSTSIAGYLLNTNSLLRRNKQSWR